MLHFRDPVHGFIDVTESECAVVDTAAFQRLRRIKQLATTYLVYHGAEHTRFGHSLGVMHLTSRVFDSVLAKIPISLEATQREGLITANCFDWSDLPTIWGILPSLTHLKTYLPTGESMKTTPTIFCLATKWQQPSMSSTPIFRESTEPNSKSARKQSGLLTLVMILEAHFTNQFFLFSSLSWTASLIATRWTTSSAIRTTAA